LVTNNGTVQGVGEEQSIIKTGDEKLISSPETNLIRLISLDF
jgi:hypothetical protein